MQQDIRSSWWTKLIAIGFILLILMGNFWVVFLITGQAIPEWLQSGFMANIGFLVICCLGFGGMVLWRLLRGRPAVDEDSNSL